MKFEDTLLKAGVQYQANAGQNLFAVFKHLVQIGIALFSAAATYALVDAAGFSGGLSAGASLVAAVVILAFLYKGLGVASTAAVATTTVSMESKDDEASASSWYGWQGVGLNDDLIKDEDL